MERSGTSLSVARAFPAGSSSERFEIESVLSLISESGGGRATQHLVLHTLQRTASGRPVWYSFNDYCIAEAPAEDALDFTQPWRSPICLVYRNASANDRDEDLNEFGRADRRSDIQSSPEGANAEANAQRNAQTTEQTDPQPSSQLSSQPSSQLSSLDFGPLAVCDLPGEGDLVAIDCEFVALNCEEVIPAGRLLDRRRCSPTGIASCGKRRTCSWAA